MKAPTFRVEAIATKGKPWMSNMIVPEWNDEVVEAIIIEDVGPYGCEGEGHYLGTSLPPGRYKIIRVTALEGETDE